MLNKTKGIILHNIKYTDSSIIVYVYTEKQGRQSYILYGIRGKKSKVKISYLQPLHLVNMEVLYKSNKNLQNIKEIKPEYLFKTINTSFIKQTIVMFLSEILYKSLKEETPNPELFNFLFNSIKFFDTLETGIANFHLLFLVQLTKYLGFFPSDNYNESNKYFDVLEGTWFITGKGYSENRIDDETSRLMNVLCNTKFYDIDKIKLNQNQRTVLLETIIKYYQTHLITIKAIKSHEVLKAVFSE